MRIAWISLLIVAPLAAQTSTPSFDVASVKPAAIRKAGGEGGNRARIEYSPNSLNMWNVGLHGSIQWAYGVKAFQVSGADALGSESYDIQAKSGERVSVSQLRLMLQDLLARRFKLVLRRETRMLPVYEMVAARGAPRLPKPKEDTGSLIHTAESLPRVENGSFVFRDTTMSEFAEKLSLLRGIEQPVLDRTGIPGVYDITLKGAAAAILQPDGPSLFTILQEQLGLKLVSAKSPVEVLVVDRVERPSAN